jgi:hypothetical protein
VHEGALRGDLTRTRPACNRHPAHTTNSAPVNNV